MTTGEYRHYLRKQVEKLGTWLIDNADKIVADVGTLTQLEITFVVDEESLLLKPKIIIERSSLTSEELWGDE